MACLVFQNEARPATHVLRAVEHYLGMVVPAFGASSGRHRGDRAPRTQARSVALKEVLHSDTGQSVSQRKLHYATPASPCDRETRRRAGLRLVIC